jgi:probable phosphoglycerate mutase
MIQEAPVIAYIDGGARGNPGPAGYGVRVETADGTLIEELHNSIGVATNNIAEYRALVAALTYLDQRGFLNATIRSDSQLLTKQMLGEYRVRSPSLSRLHREASALVKRLSNVQFEHIPRSMNAEADRLANVAMNVSTASQHPIRQASIAATPGEIQDNSVLSIGVDIESISRVDNLLQRYGERFLNRIFTEHEVNYSQRRKFPAQHLAARFCAKEATMKALGTGRSLGVLWKHIEIVRVSGPPRLTLHGSAAKRFQELGADRSLVTITHAGDFAFAQVMLLKS